MEKILIVRLSAMGDVINGLPLAAAVRAQHPEAELDWVIEERWQELLCAAGSPPAGAVSLRKPLVNDIFTVNTKTWRKKLFATSTRRSILHLRRSLRAKRYTTVIDVQGAIRSAVIARFTGCDRIVGFEQPRERQARFLYTKRIEAKGTHVIEQNISLIAEDVPAYPANMLPHSPAAEAWCDEQLRIMGARRFAVLNPGAGWAAKEWPAENYRDLAKELFKDGISSIINAGPGEEALAAKISESSDGAARPLTCSIGELIALSRRASLFVGGDTGPMHLANLIGVPVVAIFGPTNPARNGPYHQPFTVIRHAESLTDYSHKSRSHAGIRNTPLAEVVAAARELLVR